MIRSWPGRKCGVQSTRAEAATAAWDAGAYVANTSVPVSASRMRLFGVAGPDDRRIGSPAEVVTPAVEPALKTIPVSESRIVPAAFLTVNVVEAVERLAPEPAVLSKISVVTLSEQVYRTLSTEMLLGGKPVG